MIRRAIPEDISRIQDLLSQIDLIHHNGRPDLFKIGTKYTDSEICELLKDDSRPVFVYVDDDGLVLGYCFGIIEVIEGDNIRPYMKTFYIDDLCVDETCRGQKIGRQLYSYVREYAKQIGCYHITLNVWEMNPRARAFYESLNMKPLKTYMEDIL